MSDNSLQGKHIIIAGGNGFLGSSFAVHLNGLGTEVIVLSRRDGDGRSGTRFVR